MPDWLPMVERLGSFGVLVGILWYGAKVLVPRAFAAYEALADGHRRAVGIMASTHKDALDKIGDRYERSLDKRDTTIAALGNQLAAGMAAVGDEVKHLGGKLDKVTDAVDRLRVDLDDHIDGCGPPVHARRQGE